MALEGTLRDFSLADIFQLIGIQRKTGVLTLKKREDVVSISFLTGNVVSADSSQKNLEDRLGNVLVKSERITSKQLHQALRTQKSTLQRLGYVLVNQKFISQDDLREALQLQVTQIVYRLFRWKDGDYHFSQEESLDYDRANFTPISSQSILMEGIRMIDEWPLIERKIPSFDLVFEKVDPSIEVQRGDSEEEDDMDAVLGGGASPEPASDGSNARTLPPSAFRLYQRVDGRATVQELIDGSRLGDFDTCRVLFELIQLELIREVRQPTRIKPTPEVQQQPQGNWVPMAYVALVLVTVVSLATMALNPLNLVPLPFNQSPTVDSFKRVMSRNRMDRIDHALYLFFLEHHRFAPSLTSLTTEGLLREEIVVEPWGRYYAYEILEGGYRIIGYDNGGVEDPTLARVRRFPTGILPERTALDQGG